MIFDVFAYLNNDISLNKEIKEYPQYIDSGILLDEDMLYLLIVGEFVNKQQNKKAYLLTEKIKFDLKDFNYLVQFLGGFHTDFFITSPIFTKFIHLLWDNIDNEDDYKEIISIFNGISEFIKEKHLDKKYFFEEEKFKTMKWDIINSSLILTSRNHNHNTILTCKLKTSNICDKCGCLVIYYENIKSAYLNNYFR